MQVGSLLLVGCGKMGAALLDGWLARELAPGNVVVVEPGTTQAAAAAALGVRVVDGPDGLPVDFAPEVVVLAVKPQAIDAVAPLYARFAGPETVYLSIAAGKTIAEFERHFGSSAAIVRSMPNTPAAVGRGMLVGCPNGNVTPTMRAACDDLLAAVGVVAWVDDERLMDAVTAVSGSGPAYVFLLIESLAKAGVAAGLPAPLATLLAETTVAGAGELARQADEDAATLRQNVTSPAGTTEAALDVLMAANGLPDLIDAAVDAAARRSRELAG